MNDERPSAALHDGSDTFIMGGGTPPSVWVTIGDEAEHLLEGDPLPRRGYALRPDLGAVRLYEDGALLGRVVREEWFKDYTSPNPVEAHRVQYEPARPAA